MPGKVVPQATIPLFVQRETERGLLVALQPDGQGRWLAKSMTTVGERQVDGATQITLPEWKAIEYGFVDKPAVEKPRRVPPWKREVRPPRKRQPWQYGRNFHPGD